MSEEPLFKILNLLYVNPFLDVKSLIESNNYKDTPGDIVLLTEYLDKFDKIPLRDFNQGEQSGLIGKITELEYKLTEEKRKSAEVLQKKEREKEEMIRKLEEANEKMAARQIELKRHEEESQAKLSKLTSEKEQEMALLKTAMDQSEQKLNVQLAEKDNEIKDKQDESLRIEQQMADLEKRLASQSELEEKDASIERLNEELSDLQKRLEAADETGATAESTAKANVEKEMAKLTQTIETERAEKDKLNQKYGEIEAELNDKLVKLNTKEAELKAILEASQEKEAALKEETQAKEAELISQKQKLEENLKSLETSNLEKTKIQEELDTKNKELEEQRGQISTSALDLEAKQKELDELIVAQQALQKEKDESSLSSQELQERLTELTQQNEDVKAELETMVSEKTELQEKSEQEKNALNLQLTLQQNASKEELEAKQKELDERTAEMKSSLEKIQGEKSTLELEKNKIQKEAETLRKENLDLKSQLEESKKITTKLTSDLEILKEESETSMAELEKLQERTRSTQAELDAANKAIDALTKQKEGSEQLKLELENQLDLQTKTNNAEEGEKQKIQAAITMLFCYNLVKTYREVTNDIIQILKIIVNDRLHNTAKIVIEGFTFIDLNEDLTTVLPISSIKLNEGLKNIDEILKTVSNYSVDSITNKRSGYINYIDALIERISEKLKPEETSSPLIKPTSEKLNLQLLMDKIDLFTLKIKTVFENNYLIEIEDTVKKIRGKPGFEESVSTSESERLSTASNISSMTESSRSEDGSGRAFFKRGDIGNKLGRLSGLGPNPTVTKKLNVNNSTKTRKRKLFSRLGIRGSGESQFVD